jgi:ATP-dependent Clp protease ATP-binding subunit ClpC
MYERFTDRARKVVQLSNTEAQRFKHEHVDTPHLLLGLLKEGDGVAFHVLNSFDIDLRKARIEVGDCLQGNDHEPDFGKLPETPSFKKVIEHALDEARELNHNYVGTEHLLLGLLREPDDSMAQVLANLGLKPADVRQKVLNLLGHGQS